MNEQDYREAANELVIERAVVEFAQELENSDREPGCIRLRRVQGGRRPFYTAKTAPINPSGWDKQSLAEHRGPA